MKPLLFLALIAPLSFAEQAVNTWVYLGGERDYYDQSAATSGEFSSRLQWDYTAESVGSSFEWLAGVQYRPYELNEPQYRLDDLPYAVHENEKYRLFQNLNSLNIYFTDDFGTLLLGRKPIELGTAKHFSALDFVSPWFDLPVQQFQTGVDRIAIESPWGSKLTSVAEFGVIAGDELTWYLVNKIQFADTLNTSTIAYQDGISVISMGNKRSAANSEYWDEISWIHDEESYFRASIGRSDRLFGNWGSEFEYHYNQLGQEYTGKYADNANKLSYQRQWLTLDARHYFYMNMLNTMTANSVISTPLIWNINDGSLRYGLKADYYWSDDSGFSITGLWSTGDEGDEFAEVPATVKAEVLLRF